MDDMTLLKWALLLGGVLLALILMVGGPALLGWLLDPDRPRKARSRPRAYPYYRTPQRRRGLFRRRPPAPAYPVYRPPGGNGYGPYAPPYAMPYDVTEGEADDDE